MRSISTALAHRSTAQRARRGAHTGELQHGTARNSQDKQHGAHGAVRMRASYSTASDYSTARTAQCAFREATARRSALQYPSYSQATSRHARRSAHIGELQHCTVCYSTPATYNARASQSTTGHSRAQSN